MSFSAYGTLPGPPLQWPAYGPLQQPGSYENYAYVATVETLAGADPIVSASLALAPSGTGEMICDTLQVVGDTVIAWMRGGVAGRKYTVVLVLTMLSGVIIPVPITMQIDPFSASWPPIAPPSPGFGTPITWTSGGPPVAWTFIDMPPGSELADGCAPDQDGTRSNLVRVKQGATLQLLIAATNDDGSAFDFTGIAITAQVSQWPSRAVFATLTVTQTAIPGQLSIVQATDSWAPGTYRCDFKFVQGAIVLKSQTFTIEVLPAVTL